jgi:hypothetical protein
MTAWVKQNFLILNQKMTIKKLHDSRQTFFGLLFLKQVS